MEFHEVDVVTGRDKVEKVKFETQIKPCEDLEVTS